MLDEHGGVQGLVTLCDSFEAIVGDLPMEGEVEPEALRLEQGSWLTGGGLAIDDVKEIVGNSFEAVGLRFEVIEMQRLRVEKILVKPNEIPDAEIS